MVGLASLFLATKVEETPRRLRDVIDKAHEMFKLSLDPASAKYNSYRAEILTCEKSLLQTIAFDLTVEHPYKFILDYIKSVKGEKEIAQTAWNFVNDR
jgi:cyclin T